MLHPQNITIFPMAVSEGFTDLRLTASSRFSSTSRVPLLTEGVFGRPGGAFWSGKTWCLTIGIHGNIGI